MPLLKIVWPSAVARTRLRQIGLRKKSSVMSWSSSTMYVGMLASTRRTRGSPARNSAWRLWLRRRPRWRFPSASSVSLCFCSSDRVSGFGGFGGLGSGSGNRCCETRSANRSGARTMPFSFVELRAPGQGRRRQRVGPDDRLPVGHGRHAGDLVAPAGVAPHHQIDRREFAERDEVAAAIGARELRGPSGERQALPGGERQRVDRQPQVDGGDGVFGVGLVALIEGERRPAAAGRSAASPCRRGHARPAPHRGDRDRPSSRSARCRGPSGRTSSTCRRRRRRSGRHRGRVGADGPADPHGVLSTSSSIHTIASGSR